MHIYKSGIHKISFKTLCFLAIQSVSSYFQKCRIAMLFFRSHIFIYLSLFSYNAFLKYKIHTENFTNRECTDGINE